MKMDFVDRLLGRNVRDRVTGAQGVVTSVSFDLYGCIEAVVTPEVKEGEVRAEGSWFDVSRLVVISDSPVMELPDFEDNYRSPIARGEKGPAEKPPVSNAERKVR